MSSPNSDSDSEFLMPIALPVDYTQSCPLGETPMNASEYLFQVREEARQYPENTVAETRGQLTRKTLNASMSNDLFSNEEDSMHRQHDLGLTLEWEKQQISIFTEQDRQFDSLRQQITDRSQLVELAAQQSGGDFREIPSAFERTAWCRFCFGSAVARQILAACKANYAAAATTTTAGVSGSHQEEGATINNRSDERASGDLSPSGIVGCSITPQDDGEGEEGSAVSEEEEVLDEGEEAVDVIDVDGSCDEGSLYAMLVEECAGAEGAADGNELPPTEPLLHVMLQMSQLTALKVLNLHIRWFAITTVDFERQARWLFALLVAQNKPVHDDTYFLLRQLARRCRALIDRTMTSSDQPVTGDVTSSSGGNCPPEQLQPINDGGSLSESERQRRLAILTMLICVVANCFGQKDLRASLLHMG